jgi:hypothetical protein
MSLGLETEIQSDDVLVGLALVISIALSMEVAKFLSKSMGPQGRFRTYAVAAVVMSIGWWLTLDNSYFPSSEVVTAVIPQLQHPYQVAWQAPYGIIWVRLNQAVWHLSQLLFPFLPTGIDWMFALTIVNLPFLYIFRQSQLLTAYFMTSLFLWAVVPWDLSVLWLVCLGFLFRGFLPRLGAVLLAATAKIPVGAPLEVWKYDFLNGQEYGMTGSAFVPGHWMPYLVLAAWSIAVVLKPYISFLSLTGYYHGPLGSISEGKDNKETGPEASGIETVESEKVS